MTVVLILLGILLFLFLLAMLRANVILKYRDEVTLSLSVLFLRFRLVPAKKKKVRLSDYTPKAMDKRRRREEKKALKKKRKATEKKASEAEEKPAGNEIVGNLGFISKLLSSLFKDTFGHIRVQFARVRITVATGDAASTAILFGAVNDGVIFLLEILDQYRKTRHKKCDEVFVRPDFAAKTTTVDIRLVFTLRVWQLFDIFIKTMISYLKSRSKNKTQ